MKYIKILIVDDHRLFREAWAMLLNSEKEFNVIGETGSATVAISIARKMKPDIVFIDINMKPVDGFQLTQQMKIASPGSAIIALTMHSMLVFVKRIFLLGAKGYLTKNSSMEEVKAAMMTVLKGEKYVCQEMKDILAASAFRNNIGSADLNSLNTREVFITQLVVHGNSSKDIARELNLSVRTVEALRNNILKKLQLKNTAALVTYFFHYGI